MATLSVWCMVQLGPQNTGLAGSLLLTVTKTDKSTPISASNAPDGTNAWQEEVAGCGTYSVLITSWDTAWAGAKTLVQYTDANGIAQAIPAGVVGVDRSLEVADGYSATRAANLDNLNATVSSRSTLTLAQVQSGVPSDASIISDVVSALTAQGYNSTRAGYLDALNGLVAAIWAYSIETGVSAKALLQDLGSIFGGDYDAASATFKAIGNTGTPRVKFAYDALGNRTMTLTLAG